MQKSDRSDIYCDDVPATYEEFAAIVERLNQEGFRYYGNVSADSISYRIFVDLDEKTKRDYPLLNRVLADARKEHGFLNDVEERTWDLENKGFEIVKVSAYKMGKRLENLVAFFVRKQDK